MSAVKNRTDRYSTPEARRALMRRIRILYFESKMQQKEFAPLIGISAGAISNILTGRNLPSLLTIETISRKFNVSISWLFGLTSIRHQIQPQDLANVFAQDKKTFSKLMDFSEVQ